MTEFNPLKLQSALFLERLLYGVRLRDYQVRAAIHIAVQDYQFLSFDTGLGKTMAMVAGLVAKKNMGTDIRVILLCPLAGMKQVENTIRSHSHLTTKTLTGSEEGLKDFARNFNASADVLLVNYEAFDNPDVLQVVHTLVVGGYFNTVVLDEAQNIANIYTSNRNFFIANIVLKMKYKYMLTATPIISEMEQYANLIALMTNKLDDLGSIIHRVKAGEFSHERVPNLVQYKEREVGYTVKLHRTPEVKVTGTSYGTEIFKYTRGNNNKDLESKLSEIIKNTKGKILIYSHLKQNHQYLHDLATSLGRKVGIIAGGSKKSIVQDAFNNDELDCVVFSIPTELNLPASAIIMYDWTSMAHQAIGRGIRSESAKDYVAHIFLSETEKEVSLFNNTVLKNSIFLSQAFGKDIEPLLALNKSKIFGA